MNLLEKLLMAFIAILFSLCVYIGWYGYRMMTSPVFELRKGEWSCIETEPEVVWQQVGKGGYFRTVQSCIKYVKRSK